MESFCLGDEMESFCLGFIMAQLTIISVLLVLLRYELKERHEKKSKKD